MRDPFTALVLMVGLNIAVATICGTILSLHGVRPPGDSWKGEIVGGPAQPGDDTSASIEYCSYQTGNGSPKLPCPTYTGTQ